MNIPILFEDEFLCVIDKPAHIVVNRAESVLGATIQDWMEDKLRMENVPPQRDPASGGREWKMDPESEFYKRGGVVHRIDKETSGILLLAKTSDAFSALQLQFKERTVVKTYTALVHGILPKTGDIRVPIARLPWNREQFGVIPGGRDAETSFKVIKYLKSLRGLQYSLVEVFPKTGRTHQIRVHFKYLGYPLVSDSLYTGRKLYKSDVLFCPRLFLHASSITFTHPVTHLQQSILSALPADLGGVIKTLQVL